MITLLIERMKLSDPQEAMMRIYISILLLMMITAVGCTTAEKKPHEHTPLTKHYEESIFLMTKNSLFSVEMVIKDKELTTGVNAVDIIIHDQRDKDVTSADITVTPWMPGMGHGVLEKPIITERGGGLYTVENIMLIMSGHWELQIGIQWETEWLGETVRKEDSAVFNFPDIRTRAGHKHKMMTAPATSDLDLSATRMSENGSFKATYKSDIEPIPVNKIHGWTLKLETPDGKPVKDAEISIDGDMPEHGHGLPTQPEVTQELGGGEYLVEGMKFSMPGWWNMKFIIKTRHAEESVMFNLLLKE